MLRFVFSLVLLSTSLFSSDIPEIYKKSKSSIVIIEAYNGNAYIRQGSGFYYKNNLIATNYHVIEGADYYLIKNIGTGEVFDTTLIKGYSKKYDLALLKTSTIGKPLPLNFNKKVVGSDIIALGNPQGLEGTISTGILSGIRTYGDYFSYQLTAPISPGSSGGPVLDNKGEVIGIATYANILEHSQNLNFAMPLFLLSKLDKYVNKKQKVKKQNSLSRNKIPNYGWYVILGSFKKHAFLSADKYLHTLRSQDINAHLIDTDNYQNLKNDLWAIVMGPFSKDIALEKKKMLKNSIPDAYIKQRTNIEKFR